MNTVDIVEQFFENSIRPEVIIHLGTQCIDEDALPENVRDALLNDWEETWIELGIAIPQDADIPLMCDLLQRYRKTGFLVSFSTPTPQNISEQSYTFSRGYFTSKWLYADTYEEVCQKAIEWQAGYIKRKTEGT